ncbi:MAG: YlxR family protein [Solobacterium sp.]|nr:YlxR family protein [Solobacterium sp.]MDY2953072.1 YlxR family protein [Erysipelotrichaceae bacterium]MCI6878518.1 YlxR family protein [Solobacterium sp.]MCI7445726.1 YlxR family protein [Solobacterium sp.]MDD5802116.1 YlxR family protein [Solobacterium sp.]
MKKIPMRKCLASGESVPKKDLLRIVRTPEGEVKVDTTGKLNGKGAYLKKSLEALEIAKKKNLLSRALEVNVDEEVYKEIEKVING